ncbi:GspF family T2SS innner membrane protein variant ExeF [Aeromonas simiae]|uniref:General secretion pathway protein F n=1 Tax=Aeromonas simiae TaxID=218936 RepID=A0A5J6WSS4_9GAMM|nr:GspF family T2SS innner membrane protein variant ExeF [Aeromonas simiae]MDO2948663.1 GspF family T2SS innner membrane protein variant ExeF [Aeromonas simiae]MDO2952138.1 GspF family T2SS innner membrane protein variant ExeF [Aeromonas simiae]MDO2956046.1 GspF family T2SS innner membrane protein variant ExeF [Aeromonas simiae]QFI53324.1 type II secretion system protein GspF [Aeromonas simiae]
MAAFEYKALDSRGRNKSGVMEGDSARQVRQQLREQGLTPLEVGETTEKAKREAARFVLFRRGASTAELALITRQLATLVGAAMPIEEALKAVSQQCEKAHLRSMVATVRSRVVEGYSLADSLATFPHVFDQLFRSMVAAGEKSGHLEKVLNRLADYTEQRQHMRSKLLQAMIYPIVLTCVAIGVISILLTAVVPKVVAQFEHMGQQLPLTTRFLIGASELLQHYGLWFLLLCALAAMGGRWWLKDLARRRRWHAVLLRLPVIGRVSRGLNTARFARTLSILNASAVPLLEGMKIAGEVLSNDFARARILEATERVREGTSLRASLEETKIFPPMMLHMIASGERSGELDSMLERAADNQDREFESQVNIALGVFEPMLVVTMAGVVLFIVMSILQPILELNNMVNL